MSHHVQASARLRAKTLCGIHFVDQNMSFRSNTDVGYAFRNMFPDSSIANDITMSETKSMYTVVYGVAPYLQSLLEWNIKQETDYVLLFDESLNKDLQSKQMDVLVRCWEDDRKVSSRYYKSIFFGHWTAVDLNNIMQDHAEESLGFSNILQISMDGPSVNWALFNRLQWVIQHDIGSCCWHILHNCFRHGADATGWDFSTVLTSLHKLFNDVPARREDFETVTKSS